MRRVLVSTAVLVAVLGTGPADAYRLKGAKWQTRTITYYTETPAYVWSVDTAAYAWNMSYGLNLDVPLEVQESKLVRERLNKRDYSICVSDWIGDYNDPSTFTDMYLSNSDNNNA